MHSAFLCFFLLLFADHFNWVIFQIPVKICKIFLRCMFSDPPNPSLSLLTPWKDVFENETVDFECKVDGPDWTFTWYKNQVHINVDPYLPSDREEPYFNITSITQDYKGGYSCKAHLERRGVSSGFSNTVDVEVYGERSRLLIT